MKSDRPYACGPRDKPRQDSRFEKCCGWGPGPALRITPSKRLFKLVGYAQVHAAGKDRSAFSAAHMEESESRPRPAARLGEGDQAGIGKGQERPVGAGQVQSLAAKSWVSATPYRARSVGSAESLGDESKTDGLPETGDGPIVLGLDLGQNAAMSCGRCLLAWTPAEASKLFAVFPGIRLTLLDSRPVKTALIGCTWNASDRGELLTGGRARVSDVGALLARMSASALGRTRRPLSATDGERAELRQTRWRP